MSEPCWWLILNGKSAGDEAVRAAVGHGRGRGIDLQVRVTWEAGDEARFVAEALEAGATIVIAAGGDGSLGAVAAALVASGRETGDLSALGLLPLGTANDFASAAGLPVEPDAALALIAAAPAQAIDLLRLRVADGREHWCVNLASGGFGTEVTTGTHAGLKKALGGLAYVLTGLAKLGSIEPIRARLHGEGFDWQGEFIALGIGNGPQAGGGQALCPDARIDDGLLEVTVVPPLGGELLATLGTALTDGRDQALDRAAVRARLPWLEVETPEPLTLNLDGEPVASRRFRIDCVPARLRMVLPAGCPLLGAAPPGRA